MPTDPLQLSLRDIHYPDAVSWWPLALGWWLLLLIVILLVLAIVYFYKKKQLYKNSKELHARLQFEYIKQDWQEHQNNKKLLNDLSGLLRRISLNFYSREEVASLAGNRWLEFLDKHVDNREFSQGAGLILKDAPYKKNETINAEQLLELCEAWMKNITSGSKA